jgi:beta-mannanase
LISLERSAAHVSALALAGLLGLTAFLLAPAAPVTAGDGEVAASTMEAKAKRTRAKESRRRRSVPPVIGVYDPASAFRNEGGIAIEHYFVFWQALDRDDLQAKIRYAETRRRRVMITVEPYTTADNWVDGGDVLLARVEQGDYDQQITTVCTEIAAVAGSPLVRWGHEMDDRSGRYPWAGRAANDYIAAYRYFVRRCRTAAPRAEFVWSPMGRPDLQAYYPGGDYVDHVGIPIWGYQAADRRWFGKERTFAEALDEKYSLVEKFDKPVIVAEFGVSGSGKYKRSWFGSYLDQVRSFPLVSAITYFNDREPYKWPDGLGSPDWRVKPLVIGLD